MTLRRAFQSLRKGLAKTRRSFTAALRTALVGKRLDEDLLREIEKRLIEADLGVQTATRLVAQLREQASHGSIRTGEEAFEFLKARVASMLTDACAAQPTASEDALGPQRQPRTASPRVVLVVGVNGAGKTTTIAKLAKRLTEQGERVLLGACDTFRAGAVHQLTVWAQRLGVDIVKGSEGGDPAAVAFDACQAAKARGVDTLILDTAGRLHTQAPLMRQLRKIRDVAARHIEGAPHETLLVLDATTGQNALEQARIFQDVVDVTGLVLTKLDGTARGGIVAAVASETGLPVRYVGVGETLDDLTPFDPHAFAQALFEPSEDDVELNIG
ncbi:MAG: signal recognition particle-docking protein FtsY [Planctomycetota bacterium]|nr:MAG: signal recognition particle-docking protein FtsY [Planctomycetota bacterium]